MMKEHILKLFDYNYWANKKVLDTARQLTEEQFTQASMIYNKSLRGILVHAMFAEWAWLERMLGSSPTKEDAAAILRPQDYPTVEDLIDRWDDEEITMRIFLEKLTDETLGKSFSYTVISTGEEKENIYQDVLQHIVLHGMQHRSEAAAILTDYGFSPGNLDFIVFLREKQS
jgi:uncharacterized damage-inducible protein DinB